MARADIIAVDDTPANLQLLAGMLKEHDYKVRPVPSGRLALKAARSKAPDVILLDINMPEMDGYEVCRQLKTEPELAAIPVIFISALDDTFDKVRAFEVGGVDFVTKPFQFAEVEARIETHLELHRLRQRLARQNGELRVANEELRALEAMRDSLMHMLVHDLRSPLSGIVTYLQILQSDLDASLNDENREDIAQALRSSGVLMQMINNLLDIGRMEAGEMPLRRERVDLGAVVADAVGLVGDRRVRLDRPAAPVSLHLDEDLIRRVVANLVANALRYSPEDRTVVVTIGEAGDGARVSVEDQGPGVPAEYQQRIFEKFGQVAAHQDRKKRSTGLGLAFCRLAVEAHGGRIGVESGTGRGSTFWFELPAGRPRARKEHRE